MVWVIGGSSYGQIQRTRLQPRLHNQFSYLGLASHAQNDDLRERCHNCSSKDMIIAREGLRANRNRCFVFTFNVQSGLDVEGLIQ